MYSVLIVEDERPARELVKKLGNWARIKVSDIYEENNALSGLKRAEEVSPDIIICDMNMPEKDGAYFLRELKKQNKSPKVLVVSAHTDFEYTQQAILSRVFNYLLKPIDPVEFNRNLLEIYNILEEENPGQPQGSEEVQASLAESIHEYVEKHYESPITLDELAGKFYASKEHISRSFKRKYQIRLFDYINEFRLEKVQVLLRTTSLNVDEIAVKTGFSCGNYLSKVFKKRFGVSPGEYRFS